MIISQVVSFAEPQKQNTYIPWSQRSKLSTLWKPIQAWAKSMANTIGRQTHAIETRLLGGGASRGRSIIPNERGGTGPHSYVSPL
jgi:hypothetical protein